MLDIDVNSPREQRKFGLSIGGGFAVLGLLRFWWHDFAHVPYILWSIAIVGGVLAVVAPGALRPALRVAVPITEAFNWVLTRVTLTFAFYLIITPSGLLYRWKSGDPLKRAWEPGAETYWEDPDLTPKTLEEVRTQF